MSIQRLGGITLTMAVLAFGSTSYAEPQGAGSGMGMMGMHGMMMGEGDAKVSKEQFLKHAEERFGRMDANKDGVIDATDRKAMRERMKDCMGMMGDKADGMQGGATGGSAQDHEAHHPR